MSHQWDTQTMEKPAHIVLINDATITVTKMNTTYTQEDETWEDYCTRMIKTEVVTTS